MIVSAAVKFTLDDYCGTEVCIPVHRHKDAVIICKQLLGYKPAGLEEGFFTEEDEFLGRSAALQHAYECGQLKKYAPDELAAILNSDCLMSEDLW